MDDERGAGKVKIPSAMARRLDQTRSEIASLVDERDMLREALRRALAGNNEPDNVHAAWALLLGGRPPNTAAAERGLASIRAAVEAKKGTP